MRCSAPAHCMSSAVAEGVGDPPAPAMWPLTGRLSHDVRTSVTCKTDGRLAGWRQPKAERPTALEITAAQSMLARFDGFEQLAAGYGAATSENFDQVKAATPRRPEVSRGLCKHFDGGEH
jgi:hypothetical protein